MEIIFFDYRKNERQKQFAEEIRRRFPHDRNVLEMWSKIAGHFHENVTGNLALYGFSNPAQSLVFIHSTNDGADSLRKQVLECGGRVVWYSGEDGFIARQLSANEIKLNYNQLHDYLGDLLAELARYESGEQEEPTMDEIFVILSMGSANRKAFNRSIVFKKPLETLVVLHWLLSLINDEQKLPYLDYLIGQSVFSGLSQEIKNLWNNTKLNDIALNSFVQLDSTVSDMVFEDFIEQNLPETVMSLLDNHLENRTTIQISLIRDFLCNVIPAIQLFVRTGEDDIRNTASGVP